MTLTATLVDFQGRVGQCDNLISIAHAKNAAGAYVHPRLDIEQITIAAFLNFFIAWEGFLEDALTKLMAGEQTRSGTAPVRYVIPSDQNAAKNLVKGNNRYFDYANTEFVRNLIKQYFENGYPFEPHMGGITMDLLDLRTMRNASAHITTGTQRPLEAFAQRVFATARPGITLYDLIISVNPQRAGTTVYSSMRDKLLATADLITQG